MIAVIFGSSSDKKFYSRLIAELCKAKIPHDLSIASAHKTPALVEEAVKGDYDMFIAGAGLSAALPGVIASKTLRPVIGIPLNVNFGGLDALLSVWQMPKGVPVLGAPIENVNEAVKTADLYAKGLSKIKIVKRQNPKADALATKAEKFLSESKIHYEKIETDTPNFHESNAVYIDFADLNDSSNHKENKAAVLNVPYSNNESTPEDALRMQGIMHGLWLGLENYENACLAAIQLVNSSGKYDPFLEEHRKKMAEMLLEAKP